MIISVPLLLDGANLQRRLIYFYCCKYVPCSSREGLEVTDDVSIVEHLNHPVYITEGSYTNIKVITAVLTDLFWVVLILSIP